MTYLCLIFIPPVYFLTRKKWGGFCLNAVLYGLACLLVLTIALAFGGFCFWLLSVGHASFCYRREQMHRHAALIATKMAEKMREISKP